MTEVSSPGRKGTQKHPEATIAHHHSTMIPELELFRIYMIPAHILDHKGLILYANVRELEILGYTAKEYVGKHINEFVCAGSCGYFHSSASSPLS